MGEFVDLDMLVENGYDCYKEEPVFSNLGLTMALIKEKISQVKTPRGRATGHLKTKNQKLTDYCYDTLYNAL